MFKRHARVIGLGNRIYLNVVVAHSEWQILCCRQPPKNHSDLRRILEIAYYVRSERLAEVAGSMRLSARGHTKIMGKARMIAILVGAKIVRQVHMVDVLNFGNVLFENRIRYRQFK